MKLKKGDIVRRLYDVQKKTNLLWEIVMVDTDRAGKRIYGLELLTNRNHLALCYPSQLQKLERIS